MTDPARQIVEVLMDRLKDLDWIDIDEDENEAAAGLDGLYKLVRENLPETPEAAPAPQGNETEVLLGWLDGMIAQGGAARFVTGDSKAEVVCALSLHPCQASGTADTSFGALVRAQQALRGEFDKIKQIGV